MIQGSHLEAEHSGNLDIAPLNIHYLNQGVIVVDNECYCRTQKQIDIFCKTCDKTTYRADSKLHPANEIHRYNATLSLIGLVQT